MCGLCGLLGSDAHWADLPGDVASDPAEAARLRRLERQQRVRYLNPLLARFACSVSDWQGNSYLLRSFTGKTAIVADLSALWIAVEQLTGRRPDPLSPLLRA